MRPGMALSGEEGKRFAMGLIGGCCVQGWGWQSARLAQPFGREALLAMPLCVEGRTEPDFERNERLAVDVKR